MALLDLLAGAPLLTLSIVLGVGLALGQIPFGPVRLGPAGALFVGLAVGALDPRLSQGLASVKNLGLVLFVYTIGLAAGPAFFRSLRRLIPVMASCVAILAVTGAVGYVLYQLLGLDAGLSAGNYAGALTSTPAMAALLDIVQETDPKDLGPAIGYSLAYPGSVVVAIIFAALALRRPTSSPQDPPPAAAAGIVNQTVLVQHPLVVDALPGSDEGLVIVTWMRRDGVTGVCPPGSALRPGDLVVVVGVPSAVRDTVAALGRPAEVDLTFDRSTIDFRRMLVSKASFTGRKLGDLDLYERFGAVVARVRREDLDLVPRQDLIIEQGDRLRIVGPRDRLAEVAGYLGDSQRRAAEIDVVALGAGLTLGFLLGLVVLDLGGITLTLGAAGGPLLVGMILGRLERTGPLSWQMPRQANAVLGQVGVAVFLAAVGLESGPSFVDQVQSRAGVALVLVGLVLTATCAALLVVVGGRLFGYSGPRLAGLLAGIVTQPAVYAFANGRVVDERIAAGYAALFAVAMIAKIVVSQVLLGLL